MASSLINDSSDISTCVILEYDLTENKDFGLYIIANALFQKQRCGSDVKQTSQKAEESVPLSQRRKLLQTSRRKNVKGPSLTHFQPPPDQLRCEKGLGKLSGGGGLTPRSK